MGFAPISPEPEGNFLEAEDHLVSPWARKELNWSLRYTCNKTSKAFPLCALIKEQNSDQCLGKVRQLGLHPKESQASREF